MKLGFKIIISILLIGLLIGGVQATNSFLPFNNNFNDNSGRVWTLTGVVPFSTTIFKYGGSSANWSNNTGGNYLYSNASGTTYTNFSTSPFTIDWYFYRTENSSSGYNMVFMKTVDDNWNTGYGFYRHTGFGAGTYRFYWGDYSHYTSAFIPLNTWTHIAVIGNGTYTKLYLNGNYTTQLATSANVDVASPFTIGGEYGYPSYASGGYINDFNITAGSQVWTSNFTPPVYSSAPVVSFTTNVSSGLVPLSLYLNDTSTGSPTMWNTSWGDAPNSWTNQTSFPATNITHIYSTVGSYTITEYASNAYGTGSATTTITSYGIANSRFSSFNTAGTTPFTTYLYDLSTNTTPGPATYFWDMGDGNTSTSQNLYYTWNITGTYTVKHSMNNGLSIGWNNKTGYITVGTPTPPVVAPVASFYGGPQVGAPPLTVFFTDVSTNTPTGWNWSMGDGTWINGTQNPTHIYSGSGFFTVSLIASNSAGSNTTTQNNFVMVY